MLFSELVIFPTCLSHISLLAKVYSYKTWIETSDLICFGAHPFAPHALSYLDCDIIRWSSVPFLSLRLSLGGTKQHL